MDTKYSSIIAPRLILGIGIILMGILFLLGNLDLIDPHEYFQFWPTFLILIGIAYIIQCHNGSGRVWGIILVFIGTAMLLHRLHFIQFSLWSYWPVLLIVVGIMMIMKASSHWRNFQVPPSENADANSYIKAIAVMGGFKRSNSSQEFKGGELTAIMGGLEIDLRDASIKGEAIIDIFAMMGGVEMRVPEDWLVVVEGFPFMGGYEDKTRPPKVSTKRLVIKGIAVMGGVEIKN
jgi:predicted membrane protein